ncbi:hypothetical protein G6F23_014512 [Rhizopus arrhizus]|nr:hypothetical protein G6F23_014512 [Rhizopus arrhizus]
MTGAGAPAAELACRYLVAEQYGPPIACAGAVTLHMEAHQHAVGIECLAPAGVRHDAIPLKRGPVHRSLSMRSVIHAGRSARGDRPTRQGQPQRGGGDAAMVSERPLFCNTLRHLASLTPASQPGTPGICDDLRRLSRLRRRVGVGEIG